LDIVRPPVAREPREFLGVSEEPVFDLARLVGALRRRKVMIAAIVTVVTGLAAVRIDQITPLYLAEASVILEGSRQNIVKIEQVAQGLTPDFYTNETEAAIIRSRGLAERVAAKLDLVNNPLFNPYLAGSPEPGLLGGLLGARDRAGQDQGMPPAAGPAPSEREILDYVTEAFLSGLTVVPSERARMIQIQYVSPDAQFAATAANAAADAYIENQISAKGDLTSKASEWLNERVLELRKRVVESEEKLEEFRARSGIVEVRGSNVLQDQIAKLSNEHIEARAKRVEAEARYEQLQTLLKSKRGAESATAVLSAELIVRLREQEAQVVRRIAELKTQFRDEHPKMILARSELEDLQRKIAAEVKKIVTNYKIEVEIARVRERNLQSELDSLEQKVEDQNGALVTLRALVSEVQVNKQLYETVLARFKEIKVVDDELQKADARVISRAVAPSVPFYPQKELMVLAAFIVSLIVSAAIALILEFLDTGFHSLGQIESVTGMAALVAIPIAPVGPGAPPHAYAMKRPNSSFSEAVRSLRTALMLSRIDAPPKTVLITSALSGEGKTTTALSLACLAGAANQRCIIVDCDLRNPNLQNLMHCPGEYGLTHYLTGQAAVEDVVELDETTGIHVIAAGARAPDPAELLGSNHMRQLLRLLHEEFDLVVLDSPPLLAVSDTLVLVRHVEKTVIAVRWERTRRESLTAAVKQLLEAGADLAGVVLTQVDAKKQARYGRSDAHAMGATGAKYYSE
jgi:capsular exopolysaccharide synthesis family protein